MALSGICQGVHTTNMLGCLQKVKKRALTKLATWLVCAAVLVPICLYALYSIYLAYSMYKSQQDSMDNNKPAPQQPLLDPSNDNNVVVKVKEESMEDYDTITKTIQSSFASYSNYNLTMNNYYKNTFSGRSNPDPIDVSVLNPDNDDW